MTLGEVKLDRENTRDLRLVAIKHEAILVTTCRQPLLTRSLVSLSHTHTHNHTLTHSLSHTHTHTHTHTQIYIYKELHVKTVNSWHPQKTTLLTTD
jgi:hypothetical protein